MDDEDVIRLRRTIVRLARQFNTSSTGEGLTPSQSSVLGLIVSRGPLGLAELGDLEGLNPTMVSRVVGRLHEMNLITRNPGPSDLRTASVAATATGTLVCKRIQRQQTDMVSRCLRLLDSSREATLLEALPVLEELDGILK
jgi:DNA-binding MarR family transcriptional regulator